MGMKMFKGVAIPDVMRWSPSKCREAIIDMMLAWFIQGYNFAKPQKKRRRRGK